MNIPGRGLVSALMLAAAAGWTTDVAAQEEPVIEEIIVTGTRIARRDFVSASPIVSVDAERFVEVGAPTVENVLNTMPQFVPAFTSSSNNPGNDGQANLSLRGLPVTSTLVLMDGRRIIPANGNGVVDVNMIPAALIESVEVITGGASAVYGSDAVAGVVNFRMKKEFDGVEVGGFWGQTDRGDAAQWETNLTAGTTFAEGRGRIYGSVSYAERDQLDYDDRSFSRYALGYEGEGAGDLGPGNSFVSLGSGNIEEGRVRMFNLDPAVFDDVFAGYGFAPGSVPVSGFLGFNSDRTLFSQGNNQPGSVANFRGDVDPIAFSDRFYTYNFAPDNALQLPLERKTAFVALRFDLTADTELYAQALYADYSSDSQLAPTPAQFAVPPSNPYVPEDLKRLADSRANPAAIMDFQKRLSELGPRISINEYDVLQVTAGATGAVFDGWAWDAYVQYGENDQTKLVKANALRSRIEELVFAPDGGVALCGGFDPFGPGSISPECAAYIAADGSNVAGVEQFIAEASLTGALFALPAGDVRAAVGLMHKEDEYFYRADAIASRFLPPDDRVPFVRSDIMGFNASDDVAGEDANTDAYIEVSVPLLAGRTGVESLEFVGGYRHSDYDSAGGVDAYKAELLYRPVDPLSIRASFQQAVRAPSIFELFLPQLPFDFPNLGPMGRFDPCRAGSPERSGPNAAAVEALCLAQGVPADVLPVFDGSSVSGVNGGNPDLGEEQAETYTVGAVFSSPSTQRWFEDLQIAVDWYRIDVEGAVAEVLVDEFTGYCFDPAFNPDLAADNVWCSYFDRDPTTGDMVDAKELLRNVASITAEGVDLQVAWRLDAGPGQVRVSWLLSWLDSFERLVAIGAPSVENAGTIGGMVGTALPEWKSLLTLGYDWNAVSTTLQWRYIDSMRDAEVPEFKVASYDYFDFYATYDFMAGPLDGLTLRLGVVNLTDEAPPIYPTYVQANTDPSQYDAFGRRYTVGLTYRF